MQMKRYIFLPFWYACPFPSHFPFPFLPLSPPISSPFLPSLPLTFSSSCLIAGAWTSSTVLNKSNENGHSCLSLLGIMLAVVVLLLLFCFCFCRCSLWSSGSSHLFLFSSKSFDHEWVLNFFECFFCINWYDCVIFLP